MPLLSTGLASESRSKSFADTTRTFPPLTRRSFPLGVRCWRATSDHFDDPGEKNPLPRRELGRMRTRTICNSTTWTSVDHGLCRPANHAAQRLLFQHNMGRGAKGETRTVAVGKVNPTANFSSGRRHTHLYTRERAHTRTHTHAEREETATRSCAMIGVYGVLRTQHV